MKGKMISFRAEPALFDGIKAIAERRGMTVSDYARLMCSLELFDRTPELPKPLLQELKDTLADFESYARLDPVERLTTLKRSIEAIIAAQQGLDEARKWIVSFAGAEEAYMRADLKRPKDR